MALSSKDPSALMELMGRSRSASPLAEKSGKRNLFGNVSPSKEELKSYVKGYKERF
jgi:hypothetical protein